MKQGLGHPRAVVFAILCATLIAGDSSLADEPTPSVAHLDCVPISPVFPKRPAVRLTAAHGNATVAFAENSTRLCCVERANDPAGPFVPVSVCVGQEDSTLTFTDRQLPGRAFYRLNTTPREVIGMGTVEGDVIKADGGYAWFWPAESNYQKWLQTPTTSILIEPDCVCVGGSRHFVLLDPKQLEVVVFKEPEFPPDGFYKTITETMQLSGFPTGTVTNVTRRTNYVGSAQWYDHLVPIALLRGRNGALLEASYEFQTRVDAGGNPFQRYHFDYRDTRGVWQPTVTVDLADPVSGWIASQSADVVQDLSGAWHLARHLDSSQYIGMIDLRDDGRALRVVSISPAFIDAHADKDGDNGPYPEYPVLSLAADESANTYLAYGSARNVTIGTMKDGSGAPYKLTAITVCKFSPGKFGQNKRAFLTVPAWQPRDEAIRLVWSGGELHLLSRMVFTADKNDPAVWDAQNVYEARYTAGAWSLVNRGADFMFSLVPGERQWVSQAWDGALTLYPF